MSKKSIPAFEKRCFGKISVHIITIPDKNMLNLFALSGLKANEILM